MWVEEPWKFALWALGLALDVFLLIVVSGRDSLAHAEQHVAALRERDPERMRDFAGRSRVGAGRGVECVRGECVQDHAAEG